MILITTGRLSWAGTEKAPRIMHLEWTSQAELSCIITATCCSWRPCSKRMRQALGSVQNWGGRGCTIRMANGRLWSMTSTHAVLKSSIHVTGWPCSCTYRGLLHEVRRPWWINHVVTGTVSSSFQTSRTPCLWKSWPSPGIQSSPPSCHGNLRRGKSEPGKVIGSSLPSSTSPGLQVKGLGPRLWAVGLFGVCCRNAILSSSTSGSCASMAAAMAGAQSCKCLTLVSKMSLASASGTCTTKPNPDSMSSRSPVRSATPL